MKKVLIFCVAMASLAFTTIDHLTGRWETKPSVNGNVTGVVFKADNSFEGYINKKPFTSGRYTIQDSLFSFVDNGCEGKQGIYKMIFFSHSDSLRLEPVSDSCNERREGMRRLVLGRVK